MTTTRFILQTISAGFLLAACGNPAGEISPTSSYDKTEPADIEKTLSESWKSLDSPVVSFASIDNKYARHIPFDAEMEETITLTGWKGERLSAQIVVSAPESLGNLRCSVGDFESADSRFEGIGQARFVKYVLSDTFLPEMPCGVRPENNPAHLEPDMLDDVRSLDVPAMSSRPIWITIEIPQDAAAGIYTGKVSVKAKGLRRELAVNLNILDRTLPEASEWEYHLDLWQHPGAVARFEGVEPWSDGHFDKMLAPMQLLADAGQKVITATLNKDPWNHQCYDGYDDMIIWTKHADGSWKYDYTAFDRWVEFMLGLGIDKYINCYSMAPWNDMLHYTDAATGRTVDIQATPGTPEFKEMWTPFLKDFVEHLRTKGWLGITNIAMDERSPETMEATVSLLAETAPELGIALADNHESFKKFSRIKDMCTAIHGTIEKKDIEARRADNMTTTFYVYCGNRFPNTYTSSQSAEAVYLSWYSTANGYDGFLRWAYNSWTEKPIQDSRFRTWTAGDTYITYPGGLSSIRFERLREGIQDWEKISILRKEFESEGNEDKLRKLEELLVPFRSAKEFSNWPELLNEAKTRLNEF